MKRGLQEFGDQGAMDMEKESRQLLTMDTIGPDNIKYLMKEYRRDSLG